jgi:hypothetical protein
MRRKLSFATVLAGVAIVAWFVGGLSSASAATCTLTVKLVSGQTATFPIAAGAPTSSVALPPGAVVLSETCAPTPPPSSSTPSSSNSPSNSGSSSSSSSNSGPRSGSSSPSSSSSSSTSSSSTSTSTTGKGSPNSTGGRRQKRSSHNQGSNATGQVANPKKNRKPKVVLPTGKGVPRASNPTFSLSLPGPAPIGVPNFFIDSFQIPPFLLPIYQAAGVQYDVPWQVLAAINEIETDYGRNLSVSTAGAVGWMQFLPSTWKTWGVDANGDGVADPYNPVDAIFSAARYLHAAGASKSVPRAIFAYNHADWYVQSVLLRAKLIGGIPDQLIGALSGLVEGHFPVAAPAKYADGGVPKLAKHRIKRGNAAIPIVSNPHSKSVSIFAKQGSPAIAVNDGKIVKIGQSRTLGHYLELQDETGNIFTYAHLGSIPTKYPVPKPVKLNAADLAKELSVPTDNAPLSAASAGSQQASPAKASRTVARAGRAAKRAAHASGPISLSVKPASAGSQGPAPASAGSQAKAPAVPAGAVKERLFAQPNRPGSYAAGGALQLQNNHTEISNFQNYFSDVLHLARNQYTLQPLKAGAIVVSGTILGRVAAPTPNMSSHMDFMIQPAGKNAPLIDPKPILDGWKLLEATAVYRAAGVDPFFGPGAKNPSVGQVLLMSKEQLTNRILQDPKAQIYACGRRDIQAGVINRRILALIEFMTASGLDPTVTGLECGHSRSAASGTDAAGATGNSIDISKINGITVKGHTGAGSVTDMAVRRMLTLQGLMKPTEIISTMSYKGQPNTLALPDHANRIQVTYTPEFGTNKKLSKEIKSILMPGQWIQLINRISQLPEPIVPIAPSKYAVRTKP